MLSRMLVDSGSHVRALVDRMHEEAHAPRAGAVTSFDVIGMLSGGSHDLILNAHLERSTEYSHWLALALGCAAEEARQIRFGGMLHDIGKVAVSESVLLKNGPLTPAETAEMRRHAAIGAKMVALLHCSVTVAPIVAAHHERWDGLGYPRGLLGMSIPLGARIVSVADGFDAMSTDRPYRSALPHQEVVRRMRQGRGTQWQPEIVDALLELVRRGVFDRLRSVELAVGPTRLMRVA
jgi:cyclic di-GMP phosphodiesterase